MTLRVEEWERWQGGLTPTLKRRFVLLRQLVEAGGPVTVGQVIGELFPGSKSAVTATAQHAPIRRGGECSCV